MSYISRVLRERRLLFPASRRGLIVPIDHGLTLGPIAGMTQTADFEKWIGSDHISAIIAHKGLIERLILRDMLHPATGIILHLNGMASIAPEPDTKIPVASVDAALELGADAVSLQVNFTEDNFQHNVAQLGAMTDAAHAAGLPILSMLYDKVRGLTAQERQRRLSHLVRVVAELGSDAVKLALPETSVECTELVETHCRDIRIFFAGGERTEDERLLAMTRAMLASGAAGLCVGRNVFQHPRPLDLLRRLADCIRGETEYLSRAV